MLHLLNGRIPQYFKWKVFMKIGFDQLFFFECSLIDETDLRVMKSNINTLPDGWGPF
jgi:hypothetical protein